MKRLLFLLTVFVSFAANALESNFLPQVFSPDAAELGKYGQIPVNCFNGLPDITIPLTELRAKNYTLPVYLSYHASGNRPESHPGWVGQGWSLHAGGCINRIIHGMKDEMSRDEYENDRGVAVPEHPGYLFHTEETQTTNWSDTTRLWHESDPTSYKDHEPDEFQVNLPDIQASFYFSGNGSVAIVSKSDAHFTVSYSLKNSDFYWYGAQAVDGGEILDPDLPIDPDPGIVGGPLSLNPPLPVLPRPTVFYDACGRMKKDADNHISNVEYNNLHLPSRVSFSGTAAVPAPLPYGVQYAADGRKLRTGRLAPAVIELNMVSPRSLDISEPEEFFDTPTDYAGNLIFKNGTLDMILVDGGYISAADSAYHFFVTDHLGSVRVVTDAAGTLEHEYHYYPYGATLEETDGAQAPSDGNPFRWSGKEQDQVLGSYDFGARFYSTADSRWCTMDPLCEKYYSISPYAYCAGDPVNLVDPTGKDVWEIDYEGRIVRRITDTTQDAFYPVQENTEGGYKRIKDSYGNDIGLIYEYGTVLSSYDKDGSNFKFEFATNEDGISLFKFLADNTSVEYGLIGTTGNYSSLFTNNSSNSLDMLKEAKRISSNGFQLKFLLHNHPHNTSPSGFDRKIKKDGDKSVAKAIAILFGPNVRNYVYRPKYPDAVIPYDSDDYSKKNLYFTKELFGR